jgi:hypothetical protein
VLLSGTPTAQVDLAVAKLGSGSGTVTGNSVDCGAECSVHLDAGTAAPNLTGVVSRILHGDAGTFDLPLAPTPANPTTEPRTGGAGAITSSCSRSTRP